MATVTTPSQNLSAGIEAVYPASGQVAVGQNLANRHVDSLVNLSTAQLADATLSLAMAIDASYDPTNPPSPGSWVQILATSWQGGQVDRHGGRLTPTMSMDTTNVLPEWVRQRVTPNKAVTSVSLTVTVS